MKVLVSGSSGLIGSSLVPFLEKKGDEVFKLVRVQTDLLAHEIAWTPQCDVINLDLLEGFDAIVHLAGESIMGRWTFAYKERIWKSRVEGTSHLCYALQKLRYPPKVFLCASAIGYYGNRGNEILTEKSTQGKGFLADVCAEWEKAASMASEKGIRTINLRFGMVLSIHGGALKQMLPIFKWGLGGKLGSGQQWMSWIAIDDLLQVIHVMMQQEDVTGPVNIVSPYPIKNEDFTKTLGHLLHRPTCLTMPALAVELIFGELGKELFLSSERVEPKKLAEMGFDFSFPHIENALQNQISLK